MGNTFRFIAYIAALVFIVIGVNILLWINIGAIFITLGLLFLILVGYRGVRIAFVHGIFSSDKAE